MEFWLPYGATEVPVAVPDENLLGFLSPLESSTVNNIEGTAASGLGYQVGDRRLVEAASQAKKTVIAFNPDSAPSALVARVLAKGLSQKDVEGVCLLESAPDPTVPRSNEPLADKDLESPCPLTRHDPRYSSCVKVGQLEDGAEVLLNETLATAEIRCVVTNVAVNPFWGYSGGPSLLAAGLTSEKTMKTTLRSTPKAQRLPGVLSGNRTYGTLLHISQMIRVDFAVHVVESPGGKVVGIFAGDFFRTFEQACVSAGQIFRPPVQRKADIVISSAGGSAWDRTLFDASPSVIMAASCCKDHGIIVLVAECADGLGKLSSAGSDARDSKGRRAQSQRGLTLEKVVEYALRRIAAEHRVYLVSTLPEHEASLYQLLSAKSVSSALQRAARHTGKDATVVILPYGGHTAPTVG
jgi:nickel-dependent lactate racemase